MANVALNKTASANFSVSPFTPDKAVDGNGSALSRWVGTAPGWIKVDLGYPYWINQWTVTNMGGLWGTDYNMIDYFLQGSNVNSDNDSNWTNIIQITGNTQNQTISNFQPTRYQYFRTYVNKGLACNKTLASIMELELYEYNNPPYLSNLTISSGTLSPAFNKQVFNYTVEVPENVSQINVTPTTQAIGASIIVDGELVQNLTQSQNIQLNSSGDTTIRITVTTDNISENYIITVSRNNVSSDLTNLVVNGLRLMPVFTSSNTTYTATAPSGVSSVTVTPTALTPNVEIYVEGQTVISGQTTQPINLHAGQNQILVYVLAANPQKTYTVTVTK